MEDDDETDHQRREPRDQRVAERCPAEVYADRRHQRPRGPAARLRSRPGSGGARAEQEGRHDDLREQADQDPRVGLVSVGVTADHGGGEAEQYGQPGGNQPAPGHERDRARDGHGDDRVRLVELPAVDPEQCREPSAHPEPLRRVERRGVGVEGVRDRGGVGEAGDVGDAVELVAAQAEQVVGGAAEEEAQMGGGEKGRAGGAERPQSPVPGGAAQQQPRGGDDGQRGQCPAERLGQPARLSEGQRVDREEGGGTDDRGDEERGEELNPPPGQRAECRHSAAPGRRAAAIRPTTCSATPRPGPASSAIAARASSEPGTATNRMAAATTATHHPAL